MTYRVLGYSPTGQVAGPTMSFRVGPKICLAILWHQRQPIYKDTSHSSQEGRHVQPWVRLHAIRDHYSMASIVAQHPRVHVTINLTPSRPWQTEDYVKCGATDRALALTVKPAEALNPGARERVPCTFFDAHSPNQICLHHRFKALFIQRREGRPYTVQDLRDLQMWFNSAWFAREFRHGEVKLATGKVASVRRFVEQGHSFGSVDIGAMVAERYRIMRAVVPIHRQLQERRQSEVRTTPFYHPILLLLLGTNQATIDRPGATYPGRFAYPGDAKAEVRLAVEHYRRWSGTSPHGMWTAEGAVSRSVTAIFAQHGLRWIATDKGVLARSGRWGYQADDPDVLCQVYRAEDGGHAISVFFRDTQLSDAIGFRYHSHAHCEQAAWDFVKEIKERLAWRVTGDEGQVLTVVLDGENPWGSCREDAHPFVHALYEFLERDSEVQTVTFTEYLEGSPSRGIVSHPVEDQTRVHNLFTGSWIDEAVSAPGVALHLDR